MTGLEILVGLATNLVSSGVWEGGKAFLKGSAISDAIDKTARRYPGFEGLQFQLRKWYDSREFGLLLEDLKKPGANITNEAVVSSFIEIGGFYTGEDDENRAVAQKILTTFRAYLLEAILSSEGGLVYLAQREEALHSITHSQLGDIRSKLNALPDEILRKFHEHAKGKHGPVQGELEILPVNQRGHNIFTMSLRDRHTDRNLYVFLDFRVKSNVPAEILSLDMRYGEGHLALNQEVFVDGERVMLDDLTILVSPIHLEAGVTKRIKLSRSFSPSLAIDFTDMDDELFEIIRERLDYGEVLIKADVNFKGAQGVEEKIYWFRLEPGGCLVPAAEGEGSSNVDDSTDNTRGW